MGSLEHNMTVHKKKRENNNKKLRWRNNMTKNPSENGQY
jgi:hypothetical protein